MSLSNKYCWESDPAHAWLCVDLGEVFKAGIAHKVSHYSFVDASRGLAYLEEDRDAGLFLNAIGWVDTRQLEIPDNYTDRSSPIRGLPRFVNLLSEEGK
jgi:hypothetical protein